MNKEELICLYNILHNYIVGFNNAIQIQNNMAKELESLQVIFAENSMVNDKIADFVINASQKLNIRAANITSMNKDLLKSKNIAELFKKMKTYQTLNLDKNLVKSFEKQQIFLNSCKKRGGISCHTINAYEQLTVAYTNLYLCSIVQLKICLNYVENEINKINENYYYDNGENYDDERGYEL